MKKELVILFFAFIFLSPLSGQEIDSTLLHQLNTKISKPGDFVITEYPYWVCSGINDSEDQAKTLAIAHFLKNNPTIYIEIASHTDCRGKAEYNQKLSARQARIIRDAIIVEDINLKSRILAKGYGETKLLLDCDCRKCTEEQHRQNRRIEIVAIVPSADGY